MRYANEGLHSITVGISWGSPFFHGRDIRAKLSPRALEIYKLNVTMTF